MSRSLSISSRRGRGSFTVIVLPRCSRAEIIPVVQRDDGTRKLEALVERVIAGGNVYLDSVEEIAVFGSYRAGAIAPNDVDVLIRHGDPTGKIHEEQMRRLFAHQSYTTPFEQALRGRQRGISLVFNIRDQLERQGGFEFKSIWQRGESLETARARLEAIPVDPNAGTAPRDHVHAAIHGYEKHTALTDRERLIELTEDGTITVRRFEIDRDREPIGDGQRRTVVSGYSDRSPRRQAMNALLAHLEEQGVPITYSDGGLVIVREYDPPRYAIVEHGSLRLGRAIDDAVWVTGRSYCMLNLTGREPFAVVEVVARCPVDDD